MKTNEDGNRLHRGLCTYVAECFQCGQWVDRLVERPHMPELGDWVMTWHRRDCAVIRVANTVLAGQVVGRCEHCKGDR